MLLEIAIAAALENYNLHEKTIIRIAWSIFPLLEKKSIARLHVPQVFPQSILHNQFDYITLSAHYRK